MLTWSLAARRADPRGREGGTPCAKRPDRGALGARADGENGGDMAAKVCGRIEFQKRRSKKSVSLSLFFFLSLTIFGVPLYLNLHSRCWDKQRRGTSTSQSRALALLVPGAERGWPPATQRRHLFSSAAACFEQKLAPPFSLPTMHLLLHRVQPHAPLFCPVDSTVAKKRSMRLLPIFYNGNRSAFTS